MSVNNGLGQLYFDEYGNPIWDSINRGIDVIGAAVSDSPYYSPDDPRYQQGGYSPGGYYPQPQYYPQPAAQGGNLSLGSVGLSGVNVSPVTLLLGGIVLALIFFGKSRR